MRLFSLTICIALTFAAFGQKTDRKTSSNFIKLQGGLLAEPNSFGDYLGLNNIQVGWSKIADHKLREISVEFIKYSVDSDELIPQTGNPLWLRERTSIELEYFSSLWHLGAEESGLYVGPTLSLNYRAQNLIPNSTSNYPILDKSYGFGIGAKAAYLIKITNNFYLNLATKVTLADLSFSRTRLENPNVPIIHQTSSGIDFNMIRNQFQLLIGFNVRF